MKETWHVLCDSCGSKIYLNSEVYCFDVYCGVYCSAQCYAEAHATIKVLDEDEAENCRCDILDNEAIEKKTMMNIDGFFYIIGSIPMFILTIVLLLSNFVLYAMDGMTQTELIINLLKYLIPTFVLPSITAVIVMALDKKPIRPMIKGLFTYPFFMGSWLLINFKCLFKRETSWEKIDHVRTIKISDVSEKTEKTVEKV